MTVTSEVSRSGPYNGNGATTVFPYTFKIFTSADLLVTQVSVAGVETTLVLNTDYTVSGVLSDSGGNVTLTTALPGDGTDANSQKLTIRRVLDVTQTMDLRSQGKISAEVLERAHDRAVMLIQQLEDERARSLRLIESEAGSELLTLLPALADRKGRQLTFDPITGQPTASSPTSAAVSAAMEPVVASATLDLAAAALAFSATGGSAARGLRDRAADVVNAKDFGATGDGVTDDTVAIQAAITAGAGKTVFVPSGTYKITARLNMASAGTRLVGAGRDATTIAWTGAGASYSVGGGSVYGTAGKAAVLVTASRCAVQSLAVSGPSSGVYVASERLIVACGASAAAPITGFRLEDCKLADSGSAGFLGVFADETVVRDCRVDDIGYEAISFISCMRSTVADCRIDTVSPGVTGNAYGISLSHDTSLWPGDQATSPFSDDALIRGNDVRNILWEGISNHGGARHNVIGNNVYNVAHCICLGNSSGGAEAYAGGGGHTVIGNTCDAGPSYANNVNAFCSFRGGTTEFLKDIRIIGNRFSRLGVADSATGGVIRMLYVKNAVIQSNHITNWRGWGIFLAGAGSSDVVVSGNIITKMAAADAYGRAIGTDEDIARAVIIGNTVATDGGTIAAVGVHQYSAATLRMVCHGNHIQATQALSVPLATDNAAPTVRNISAGAGTYDVSDLGDHATLIFNLAAPQTVTNFTGGRSGQKLTLLCIGAGAVTFNRTSAYLPGGASVVLSTNYSIQLIYHGGYWYATGPIANNG